MVTAGMSPHNEGGIPMMHNMETLWHLSLNRNPHFTGRDSLLEDLHSVLRQREQFSRTQALVGMAGIGKTQIAVEYAYRHRDEYSLVWWLRADDEGSLANDYTMRSEEHTSEL